MDLCEPQHDSLPLRSGRSCETHDHWHEPMQSIHENELQIKSVLWSHQQGAHILPKQDLSKQVKKRMLEIT